jgi:hypothetical protein
VPLLTIGSYLLVVFPAIDMRSMAMEGVRGPAFKSRPTIQACFGQAHAPPPHGGTRGLGKAKAYPFGLAYHTHAIYQVSLKPSSHRVVVREYSRILQHPTVRLDVERKFKRSTQFPF